MRQIHREQAEGLRQGGWGVERSEKKREREKLRDTDKSVVIWGRGMGGGGRRYREINGNGKIQ